MEICFRPGREIVNHENLMPFGEISIDDVRSDEARPAGDDNPHLFRSLRRSRKYSMVRRRPSSRDTLGSHPNRFFALVISG